MMFTLIHPELMNEAYILCDRLDDQDYIDYFFLTLSLLYHDGDGDDADECDIDDDHVPSLFEHVPFYPFLWMFPYISIYMLV